MLAVRRLLLKTENRRTLWLWLVAGLVHPFVLGCAGLGTSPEIDSATGVEAEDGDAALGSDEADAEPQASAVAYGVEITGIEDKDLRDLIERSSLLITLGPRPPGTLAGLMRRTEGDVERFRAVLRAEGYYDNEIAHEILSDAEPVLVRISIRPGAPYTLASYDVRFVDDSDAPPPATPSLADLGLALGGRARSAEVVAAEIRILRGLRNDGRPFARGIEREVIVDHGRRTVEVDVVIDPGPRGAFGAVSIEGLSRTNEDYVRQWVPWSRGDPFSEAKVDALQSDLNATGLFSWVAVEPAETVDDSGEVPVRVSVEEGKVRSIGFGVSYSTDRGVGGRAFWRHRNLFGNNESLELSVRSDFLQQMAGVEFQRPNFEERDRTLFAGLEGLRNDTEAFSGYEVAASAGLAWPVAENWRASVAGSLDFSNLEDADGRQSSRLFGVPATIAYNSTDDALNPTEGLRLDVGATPYVGSSAEFVVFAASEATGSAYYAIDQDRRFVLAGRVRAGSIAGADRGDIPANKRFYAGGGGSIRGYEFQKVGPLDANNDPLGGRSLFETSFEVRARVWGDFGIVPFVDGGNVFEAVYPDFSTPLQWAAGIGLRYHTLAGPLRLDVAFPINRREGVDDAFQFYISLGQAF